MATNLKIDDELLAEAFKLSGYKTKREAVTEALKDYVNKHRRLEFLKLAGTVDFDPEYDYKEQRRRT